MYWGGKDRYIGTFGSQEDAALACAIVQNELSSDGSPIDPNTTTRQLNVAREKAIEAIQDLPPAKKAKLVVESQKPVVKSSSPKSQSSNRRGHRHGKSLLLPSLKLKGSKRTKNLERLESPPKRRRMLLVSQRRRVSAAIPKRKKTILTIPTLMPMSLEESRSARPIVGKLKFWQAQIYFQGKSRYIGVFDSRQAAGHAFVLTRTLLKPNGQTRMENQEASDTFIKARDKALNAVRSDPKYRVRHD